MAVLPIFYPTRDAILESVRMPEVCAASGAQPLIDRALLKVRTGIYSRLGETRVTDIASRLYTENPVSADEIERAQAQLIECEWLQAELLGLLTHLISEGGAGGLDQYQDEDPFRLSSQEERDARIEALMESVYSMLDDLGASDLVQPSRFALIEPDEASPNVLSILDPGYGDYYSPSN